jgi:hypothetical protein
MSSLPRVELNSLLEHITGVKEMLDLDIETMDFHYDHERGADFVRLA